MRARRGAGAGEGLHFADVDALEHHPRVGDFFQRLVVDFERAVRFAGKAVDQVDAGKKPGNAAVPRCADVVDELYDVEELVAVDLEVVALDDCGIERLHAQRHRVARCHRACDFSDDRRGFLREPGDGAGVRVVNVEQVDRARAPSLQELPEKRNDIPGRGLRKAVDAPFERRAV